MRQVQFVLLLENHASDQKSFMVNTWQRIYEVFRNIRKTMNYLIWCSFHILFINFLFNIEWVNIELLIKGGNSYSFSVMHEHFKGKCVYILRLIKFKYLVELTLCRRCNCSCICYVRRHSVTCYLVFRWYTNGTSCSQH